MSYHARILDLAMILFWGCSSPDSLYCGARRCPLLNRRKHWSVESMYDVPAVITGVPTSGGIDTTLCSPTCSAFRGSDSCQRPQTAVMFWGSRGVPESGSCPSSIARPLSKPHPVGGGRLRLLRLNSAIFCSVTLSYLCYNDSP